MDSEKIEVLLCIVQCGSIQGASRQLGVTRASLRRVLDALEAEVGAPLFHRHGKGVQLTAAGTVVVEQGRPLLDACRALLTDARAAVGEATGALRVIEPVGLPLALHVELLLATHAALPHQQLSIRLVENPLAAVDEPFELVLHEGIPPDRTWFSRVILRTRLQLRAAPAYLRRRGRPTDPADLALHDTVSWRRPGQSTTEWPLLDGGVAKVSPWLTSADPQVVHSVIAGGGGLALLPDLPFIEQPGGEPLETLLADRIGPELTLRVSSPFSIRTDSRTRDSLRLVLGRLAELPDPG